jgi:hypothetical protein
MPGYTIMLTLKNGAQFTDSISGAATTWQALAGQVAQAHGYGKSDIYRIVINGTQYNTLDM